MAFISDDDARTHINHFRSTLPDGETRSIWFDREFIEDLIRKDGVNRLSGVRVYFARYKEGTEPTGIEDCPRNKLTVILVPTRHVDDNNEQDVAGAYTNTGLPCPMKCNGGM